MDGQTKSILTSIMMGLATGAAGWLASHGLIPNGDQATIANDLTLAALGGFTMIVLWWKQRQHTPAALIAQVNHADNGVKVVADTTTAPTVGGPLK